jgi:hypothetical protein
VRGHVEATTTPLLACMHTDKLGVGHQASYPLAADPGADSSELAVDARCAIGRSRALIDVTDGVGQIGVLDAAIRRRSAGPGVVAAS